MKRNTKKFTLLAALFFMPVLALLFFVNAQYNFKPVDKVGLRSLELPKNDSIYRLRDNISIVSFLGNNIENNKNVFFNLNQKINKRFEVYKHLKLVIITLESNKTQVEGIIAELAQTSDVEKWNVVFMDAAAYKFYYREIDSGIPLDDDLNGPVSFLVDENLAIRGRKEDKDLGLMLGFNANDVQQVNKLKDDVKMLLKEYSIHNNRNKADRKSNVNLKDEE